MHPRDLTASIGKKAIGKSRPGNLLCILVFLDSA